MSDNVVKFKKREEPKKKQSNVHNPNDGKKYIALGIIIFFIGSWSYFHFMG